MHYRMIDPLHYFYWIHRWTSLAREERQALRIVDEYADRVIRERRQELAYRKTAAHDHDDFDLGLKRKRAFLDILLESTIDGEPLSNLDIREEVNTFMFEVTFQHSAEKLQVLVLILCSDFRDTTPLHLLCCSHYSM